MDTSSRKEVTTNSAVQTEHLETAHNMNIHLETAHDLNVHNATIFDDPHKAAIEDSPEHAARPPLSTFLAILFLALSSPATIGLPIIVVPTILLQIGEALGSTTNVGWIASSWAVTSSVSACVAGRMSDIFGRRNVILVGQAFGIVGSIVGASAQNVSTVIAGSALLGIACGLVLIYYSAVPELLPFNYRGLGLSFVECTLHLPWIVLAVLIGYELNDHASWRWCYIIAAIYGVVAFAGTAVFYYPPKSSIYDSGRTRWEDFKSLDFMGLGLFTVGITIFLVGLSWAGSAGHAWKSVSTLVPIILGLALLVACFAYDWFFVKEGEAFFPLRIFLRFSEFTMVLVCVFIAGMIYYSGSFLIPQATFYIFSTNGLQISIISLPNGFGQITGGVLMPIVLHYTKKPKWHLVGALVIQGTFTALFAYALPSHKAAWMAFQFFGQGCFAFLIVLTVVNTSLHMRHSDLGLAIGLIATFRAAGGALGDSVFGTILNGVVNAQLGPRIIAAATKEGFKGSLAQLVPAVIDNALGIPGALAKVNGVTPAIEAATFAAYRAAYGRAFQLVFLSSIPFSVLAVVAALFIKDASQYLTNHTAVVLEKNVLGSTTTHNGEKEAPISS